MYMMVDNFSLEHELQCKVTWGAIFDETSQDDSSQNDRLMIRHDVTAMASGHTGSRNEGNAKRELLGLN